MNIGQEAWLSENDCFGTKTLVTIRKLYKGGNALVFDGEHERETNICKLSIIEPTDICGLCGKPGADKVPHPEHWPGEQVSNTPFVHDQCEREECARAHKALTHAERHEALSSILRRTS